MALNVFGLINTVDNNISTELYTSNEQAAPSSPPRRTQEKENKPINEESDENLMNRLGLAIQRQGGQ